MEKQFTEIYDKGRWGKNASGNGVSGSGSNVSHDTKFYINILMDFITENNLKKICDIGCGDWGFSKTINWDGLNYMGIDCVESVIKDNIKKYSKKNISFKKTDGNHIPKGYDLIILKDVIQHWTDEDILNILPKIIENNKYVMLGNGYKFQRLPEKNNWTKRDINNIYKYHPIVIDKSPMNKIEMDIIKDYTRRAKQFVFVTHP